MKVLSAPWVRLAFVFVLLAPALGSSVAQAQDSSYRERRMMQEQSRKLSEEAEFTTETCGKRISASLNWDSFLARDGRVSPSVYRECDGALSAIERICRDDTKVEALRQKVNRVVCGGGKKTRVGLVDGTLKYAIAKGDADHQKVYDYLEGRL